MTYIETLDPVKVAAAIEGDKGKALCDRYGIEDPLFGLWLAMVDRRLLRMIRLGLMDIEDWGWRDAYDGGTSPREAAESALLDSDLYGPMIQEALNGE